MKREREEAAELEGNRSTQSVRGLDDDKAASVEDKISLPTLPTLSSKADDEDEESESESSSSEEEVEEINQRTIVKPKNEDEIVRKWNNETYIEKGKVNNFYLFFICELIINFISVENNTNYRAS